MLDALNIQMILLNIPLLILLIYIYYKSKLNGILLIIGIQVTLLTIKVCELLAGIVISQGNVGISAIGIISVLSYVPLYYYMYQDKMYILIALMGTIITFGLIITGMGHETHGDFVPVTLLIVLAWYKETKRCFNPVYCSVYKLKGKYLKEV